MKSSPLHCAHVLEHLQLFGHRNLASATWRSKIALLIFWSLSLNLSNFWSLRQFWAWVWIWASGIWAKKAELGSKGANWTRLNKQLNTLWNFSTIFTFKVLMDILRHLPRPEFQKFTYWCYFLALIQSFFEYLFQRIKVRPL